jgi:hypothetical protein
VGAVDVGVGHDDDLVVAQVVVAIAVARAAAQRLDQVGDLLVGASLSRSAPATLRILPRSGRTAWLARSRACLALPPAESPSTMKIRRPGSGDSGAVGQLAGQAQLAHGRLAVDFLFLAAAQALLGALDDPVEQLGGLGEAASQWSNGSRSAVSTMRWLRRRQLVLGLADEFRLADEHRQHRRARETITSSAVMIEARLLPVSSA